MLETSLRTPLQEFNCTTEQIPGITYSDFTVRMSAVIQLYGIPMNHT